MAISEKALAKLKKIPGMHAVGGASGLCISVEGDGCSWIFRYSIAGRRRNMGLGSLVDVSLSQAREQARAQRALVRQGIDPIESRRSVNAVQRATAAKERTFAQCVAEFLNAHDIKWRNEKHRQQWRSTLEVYVYPILGALNARHIDTALVMQVLSPTWRTKPVTASRVRQRIEQVLAWAGVHGYREGPNPARWKQHLDQLLPSATQIAKVNHHAALPYGEIGSFMAQLRTQKSIAAGALEFLILCAARSGEVLGAQWSEIDLPARMWIVPAERMKAGRLHRVALSDAAVAVLKRMQARRVSEFVFPGTRSDLPMADRALLNVLRRMGRSETVHGFRATFSTWCAELTNYPREVTEVALAHRVGTEVERSYQRGDLLLKRHALMKDWASWCAAARDPAQVASIETAKR